MCVSVREKERGKEGKKDRMISLFASSAYPPGGLMQGTVLRVCVCICVCGWMERGLLTALDPIAEEGPRDLLSSVQSIMCERPSL